MMDEKICENCDYSERDETYPDMTLKCTNDDTLFRVVWYNNTCMEFKKGA